MEFLEILKDYGSVIAAGVIAASSVYTALIIRRQNRTKGWLKLSGTRQQQLRVYADLVVSESGEIANADPNPSDRRDPGGSELVIHTWNTGRYDERVDSAHFYLKNKGWQRIPEENPVGMRIVPANSENPSPRFEEVSTTGYPKINTPFVVPAESSHELIFRLPAHHEGKLTEITCIKVETLKGETIHFRLSDAGRRFSLIRHLLCKLGLHT